MALARATASVDLKKSINKRVVDMYRKMARSVPKVLVMYNLEQTPAEARHMILLHYRKNMHVTDPRILEMFLAKAEMEFEETMNQWKQKGHLMQILQPEAAAPDAWYDEEEFFRRCVLRRSLQDEQEMCRRASHTCDAGPGSRGPRRSLESQCKHAH